MSESNGTAPQAADAPPAAEQPCEDCVTNGERVLAVLSLVFAALIIGMAIDMMTGGKLSGVVKQVREGASGD